MAMTTRCPQCGTAFKVVPDQLRVRNGLVRCGACSTVFDGRACLVAQIPQAAPAGLAVPPDRSRPPAPPAPAAVPPAISEARPEPALGTLPPAVLRGRPDIRKHDPYVGGHASQDDDDAYDDDRLADDEPGLPQPLAEAPAGTDADQDAETGTDAEIDAEGDAEAENDAAANAGDHVEVEPVVLGEARTRYYGATDVGRTPPEFLDTDRQARRHLVRSLWGYACVLGLLLLALQVVYVYRSAIATAAPPLRPLLTSLCQPLGCQIGYARRIERIFITSSSLQPPRGQAGAPADGHSHLVLSVSLRNRYDQPQHWPALRLDLTDLSDTVVVRKVLQPRDYLPPGQAEGPFEPGAEINVTVPIEVAGVQVNGFQLDKFFP
ncbi:DUF3426 domain-containing protein [Bordetella petrii]|uniref:Probable transmembrane protein n=1 Tax=Bordetella petrii (strain ATCC BAA-461 / DSM 12804 / CCUG 43448 / CIP 107267 / Se-1111R) TaxID=340100 RepID=A9I1Y2_BORPD|nr:DUF3426 domain-containing protein [Bordetella petrii]CAP40909.1 probable transmembrane protein [Bordetella petrii]